MSRRLFCLVVIAAVMAVFASAAAAFVLMDERILTRRVLRVNVGTFSFPSLGSGTTTWDAIVRRAMDRWNTIGVGGDLDRTFFSAVTVPASGNPCRPNGVNDVMFSPTDCGREWGDALSVTHSWISTADGVSDEADVVFNALAPMSAYSGPMVHRTASGERINDFYRVALHELGHVAGLDHPDAGGGGPVAAIMNGRIGEADELRPDDIAGVHALAWLGGRAPRLGTVPVYRFLDTRTGTFFFTGDEAEKNAVLGRGTRFHLNGVAYFALPTMVPGGIPVYRFFDPARDAFFFTTDEAEKNVILARRPSVRFDGPVFYGLVGPAGRAAPVYRFVDPVTGGSFFTLSDAERDHILGTLPRYRPKGVAFWAYP